MAKVNRRPQEQEVDDEGRAFHDPEHGHNALITDEDLRASKEYSVNESPAAPDFSQPYDVNEIDKKAEALRNQLGQKSVNPAKAPDPARPAPQQEDRQDLGDLMSRYERAVKESARRQGSKGALATSMNLSAKGSGDDFLKAQQGYIDAPVQSEVGRLKQADSGLGVNKKIADQFAIDEDNDPASDSSRLARSIAKKYQILDPENETATASQIKRVAPFVTTEMKGQQAQQVTETKETGSTQRKGMEIESKEKIAEQTNETKLRYARILAQAGIDRTEIAGILGLEKSIVDSAIDQNVKVGGPGGGGGGRSKVSSDGNVMFNTFTTGPNDRYMVRDPNLGPVTSKTKTDLESTSQFAQITGDFTSALLKAHDEFANQGKVDTRTWARIQSLASSVTEGQVKQWLNGVANGKDIAHAKERSGDYQSFVEWIAGTNAERTRTARDSARMMFDARFRGLGYSPAGEDKIPDRYRQEVGGGSGGGGSRSGPVFDPNDAANSVLQKHNLPPLTKTDSAPSVAPPVKDNTPKPRRWNPQTKKFEVVQ